MKIGGHFQNHGSCCVLLAWPVEVIDEFFKYLGPATTFMCVLCQGPSTVDALGISVGCHVAMINLMVAFGIKTAESEKLMMSQIGFSSIYDLVLGAEEKKNGK